MQQIAVERLPYKRPHGEGEKGTRTGMQVANYFRRWGCPKCQQLMGAPLHNPKIKRVVVCRRSWMLLGRWHGRMRGDLLGDEAGARAGSPHPTSLVCARVCMPCFRKIHESLVWCRLRCNFIPTHSATPSPCYIHASCFIRATAQCLSQAP